ncbi:MAG: hypothetical protein O3A47_09540 [Chloroflexi bacterium]|nr:hypothetical protein [Chloroflexota bacterium]
MVKVTDAAREELMRTLERTNLAQGKHLRLATPPEWTGEGDFGIVIDEEKFGDLIIDSEGRPLLLVASDLAERISTSVFDFKATPQGKGFALDVY